MDALAAGPPSDLRLLRLSRLLVGLWLLNLAVALPGSLFIGRSLRDAAGSSLVSEELAKGFDLRWYGEYEARARGLEKTFRPSVAGHGAQLDNLEAFWSGSLFTGSGGSGGFRGLVATGVGYALLWTFLLGGLLTRLSGRWEGSFWGAAAGHFPRFLALGAIAWSLYAGIFLLARRVFPWIERLTRDVTAERTVLGWNLLAAGLVVLALVLVRTACDYARIALVAGRGGFWRAAAAGILFPLRRPFASLGLVAGAGALGALLLAVYALLAPTAGPASWAGVVLAFLLGQVWILVRLGLRLALLAWETRLFRSA